MIRDRINRIISILLAVVMLSCCVSVGASAVNQGELIVVGASPDHGISIENSKMNGLAFDYLKAIKRYTGHRYSYVEATRDELFKKLAEGKIDLLPCVTKKEYEAFKAQYYSADVYAVQANEIPALSRETVAKKYTAVYTYDKNEYAPAYYDLEGIKKSTIGYLSENKSLYFTDGKPANGELDGATFREYTTVQQMKSDFYSGELDAVMKENFRSWANESIIYQYDTADCYFLVSGSNPLLGGQLDSALDSLNMGSSSFSSDIYNRYMSRYGSPKYAYSLEEKNYIKETAEITVAYNLSAFLPETYNEGTGELNGYIRSLLDKISEDSGLKINLRACNNLEDCVKLLEKGEVQAICGGVNDDNLSKHGSFRVSNPFLKVPLVFVAPNETNFRLFSKVAVCSSQRDTIKYMEITYPDIALVQYDSVEKCLKAVRDGEAEAICMGAPEASSAIAGDYSDFSIVRATSEQRLECFAYLSDSSPHLGMIIGKNITRLELFSDVASRMGVADISAGSSTTRMNGLICFIVVLAVLALIGGLLWGLILIRHNKRTNEVDTLTGGRNKQKFIADTKKLLKKNHADKLAVVLFDINKFKYVNDRLGYEEGDRMLVRIHKTIADNLEGDEIHARLSDDIFAMVIKNASDNEITTRMNTIFSEFERRNNLFVKYTIIFTAGVCRLGQCRDCEGKDFDINVALDRCKIAKRTLKGKHISSIAFYDGKIREKALRERDYENIMPSALQQHEFECYLQPKYGLKSRHIEGAEALIRWNSKEFGFVFPDEFIPLSEKNGFVVELDFYILEEVCKSMRRWLDDGKTPVVISVNQSRLHLNDDDYIWRLREIVDKYEIPYEYIELELTESVFEENSEKLLAIMQKLHDVGFKLSLDDFGSGYSSLNMLKDIPVDVVKIDREFFNGTVNSEKGRAVITTVCDLASNLNMEVISEGVETLEQVEFLSEINCAMVQGYYFARPMTIPAFEELWFKDLEERNKQ